MSRSRAEDATTQGPFYTDGKLVVVEGNAAFGETYHLGIVAQAASDTAARHVADALRRMTDRPIVDALPEGVRETVAERRRQIEAEGWTAEHDDAHEGCELVMAAGV